tara:strand:- start:818 stop:1669 length:852 start_codon:yes stop_codon:yes gene_type:complete
MKIKLKLLFILIPLFYNCSSSGENEIQTKEIDENVTPIVLQLITNIKSLNPKSWEKHGALLFYENDYLKFSVFETCSSNMQLYEYNNEGKISIVYHGRYYDENGEKFNPNNFDTDEYKANGFSYLEKYTYENGRVIERQVEERIFYYSYDEKGRVINVDQYESDGKYYYERFTYNYNNNEIESIKIDNLETGRSKLYTFEFDDKINPIYVLKTKFGLESIETCTGLDYNLVDGMIFKNNVLKLISNDNLIYSSNFEYDNNRYPIRASWIDFRLNDSNVENYFY